MSPYNLCDGTGLVCENHPNLAWGGASEGTFTCDCGAGMPCVGCISCSVEAFAKLSVPPKLWPTAAKGA